MPPSESAMLSEPGGSLAFRTRRHTVSVVTQKPQPTSEQVAVVEQVMARYPGAEIQPGMYPSGSMLLVVREAGMLIGVERYAPNGDQISTS